MSAADPIRSAADKSDTVGLGAYILQRLAELGATHIQGVPGDYNMGFLDLIEDNAKLQWVGNCNELNAAYSADGYARTAKRGCNPRRPCAGRVGAIVTTFGVGELSALNGIAGSFSERLPLVHIVGVPSTSAQSNHALLHHTLGDGRFDSFVEMSRKISVGVVKLEDYTEDPEAAIRALDKAFTVGCRQARPIYISLPTDMVNAQVPSKPLLSELPIAWPANEDDAESSCLDEILARCKAAENPAIIVDACAIRHNVVGEVHQLVDASGMPVFATPMGKSAIDESHLQFGGIYVGSNTVEGVKKRVESSDLLIQIGSLLSDFNTANFSYRTRPSQTVELHSNRCAIGFATYEGVRMKELLPKLSNALKPQRDERLAQTKATLPVFDNLLPTREEEVALGAGSDPQGITQAWLWPRMGHFLESGDQVLAETGTSSFGSLAIRLPASKLPCFHSQVLWGSIGWALPACLGVSLATREEKTGARVVLFIGDGSFQLTAQEISTMVREGLAPIIFVLANDGYEIERQIHGPERRYNNTARWDLKSFLETFKDVNRSNDISVGGVPSQTGTASSKQDHDESHKADVKQSRIRFDSVKTKEGLDALLQDKSFSHANDVVRLIEIILARGDAPKALLGQAAATQKSNRY